MEKAILTSRQTREKLQWSYENLMSNNFRRTAENLRALHALEDLEPLFKIFYTFVCKKVPGKLQTNIWKI